MNPELTNIKNGMCVVCQDDRDNSDILSIRQKQSKIIEEHVSTLSSI